MPYSAEYPVDIFSMVVKMNGKYFQTKDCLYKIHGSYACVCVTVCLYILFVGLRANIFKNMRDSQLELVRNGCDPGIVLRFEDLLWTSEIQIT